MEDEQTQQQQDEGAGEGTAPVAEAVAERTAQQDAAPGAAAAEGQAEAQVGAGEGEQDARPLPTAGETGKPGLGEPPASDAEPGLSAEQLGRLRDVLIASNPEAVPELIAGADFDSLLGSVEGAQAAYARIAERIAGQVAGGVPRGGGTRTLDATVYEGLSGEGKIAAALAIGERVA